MRGHLTNHLLLFFGTRQVREITTRDIDTFLRQLQAGMPVAAVAEERQVA